jgi:hypothetical protein
MPNVAIKESTLLFPSNKAISEFKHKCGCNDFYIDRDSLTLVGFFTQEQIQLAAEKFGASKESRP